MSENKRRRRGNGEGSIFRRASDGMWVGRIDLGYVNGKRIRKTVYGKTEREAREKLNDVRRAHERGQDVMAPQQTFDKWLDTWLGIKESDGIRSSTLALYRMIVRDHIAPVIGRVRLDKLAPADVRALLAAKKTEGLSPMTVRHIHAVVRNALSEAERLELVTRNVAKVVRVPRVPAREVRALTEGEARCFLDAAKHDRLWALWVCAITLGLRRGELLGLRWSDIDRQARTLRVRQALQRVEGELRFVEPKSTSSRRTVPVPDAVLAILDEHHRRQRRDRLASSVPWPAEDLVFVSEIGTPLEPRNLNRRFYALRTKADLPWLRLHDLRHACASFMLAAGASPRTIMETLGHSSFGLTMNTYTHVLPNLQRAATEAVGKTLLG